MTAAPRQSGLQATTRDLRHRIWRMRRRHRHIDAVITPSEGQWVLSFLHNDSPVLAWRYATRQAAIAEADVKRQELARAGWTSHW